MSLLEERDEPRQRARRVMKREFGKMARAAILALRVTVSIHFFFGSILGLGYGMRV